MARGAWRRLCFTLLSRRKRSASPARGRGAWPRGAGFASRARGSRAQAARGVGRGRGCGHASASVCVRRTRPRRVGVGGRGRALRGELHRERLQLLRRGLRARGVEEAQAGWPHTWAAQGGWRGRKRVRKAGAARQRQRGQQRTSSSSGESLPAAGSSPPPPSRGIARVPRLPLRRPGSGTVPGGRYRTRSAQTSAQRWVRHASGVETEVAQVTGYWAEGGGRPAGAAVGWRALARCADRSACDAHGARTCAPLPQAGPGRAAEVCVRRRPLAVRTPCRAAGLPALRTAAPARAAVRRACCLGGARCIVLCGCYARVPRHAHRTPRLQAFSRSQLAGAAPAVWMIQRPHAPMCTCRGGGTGAPPAHAALQRRARPAKRFYIRFGTPLPPPTPRSTPLQARRPTTKQPKTPRSCSEARPCRVPPSSP